MFDRYVLTRGSIADAAAPDGGEAPGFEMRTRIPYYRGIPLSMVHDVLVAVDGEPVRREDLRFSADAGAHWFTLDELRTVATFRWEYADEALVRVQRPGGLASLGSGAHEIGLRLTLRISYIPVPVSGERTETVTVP